MVLEHLQEERLLVRSRVSGQEGRQAGPGVWVGGWGAVLSLEGVGCHLLEGPPPTLSPSHPQAACSVLTLSPAEVILGVHPSPGLQTIPR